MHVVLQTLCTFGGLLNGSIEDILLYVGWTMLVSSALGLAVDHKVLRGQLPVLAVLGLTVEGVAPLGTRSWPALRSLVYLVIWTGVEAVVQLLHAVRIQPEAATSWMRKDPPFLPHMCACGRVCVWDASGLECSPEREAVQSK